MKRLRNAFVTGLLVLVPVFVTIEILMWLVVSLENSVRDVLPTSLLAWDFRGLGLISAILLILLTGFITQNYVGKWLVHMLDEAVRGVPLIGGLYGGIKKFLETIFNPADDRFKGAVLVEFPRPGMYSVGFRTGSPDPKIARHTTKPLANIFIPCTPNPTAGFYVLVPEDELIALDLTVQEAFKIVISMGLVTSEGRER